MDDVARSPHMSFPQFEGEESEGSGDATQPFPIEATHARKIIHKILVPPKIQHRVQLQVSFRLRPP